MGNTIVLLYKEKRNYEWSYIIDNQKFFVNTPTSSLLEQLVYLVTEIRDTHKFYDTQITICSTTLLRTVVYDLILIFPTIHFVPIVDAEVAKVFKRVATRASIPVKQTKKPKTLFVCSDASKSAATNMCGWAWYSNVEGSTGYNFGVSEHRSTVLAELEGVLRAIIDNSTLGYKKIVVYCDSQRSVEQAQNVLYGRFRPSNTSAEGRLLELVYEARKVVSVMNVKVQWVRGHQSHRLNVAADFLSREARVAANKQQRLKKDSPKVEAVLAFINQ